MQVKVNEIIYWYSITLKFEKPDVGNIGATTVNSFSLLVEKQVGTTALNNNCE